MSDAQLLALGRKEAADTMRLMKITMMGAEAQDSSNVSSDLSEVDEVAYQEALENDDMVNHSAPESFTPAGQDRHNVPRFCLIARTPRSSSLAAHSSCPLCQPPNGSGFAQIKKLAAIEDAHAVKLFSSLLPHGVTSFADISYQREIEQANVEASVPRAERSFEC